jgi:transcriptional regulator with XRE-family HTH domain
MDKALLATRMTAARERARLTKAELARKLDLDPSSITKYENGTRQPSLAVLEAWAEATGQAVSIAFELDEPGMVTVSMPAEVAETAELMSGLTREDRQLLRAVCERLPAMEETMRESFEDVLRLVGVQQKTTRRRATR